MSCEDGFCKNGFVLTCIDAEPELPGEMPDEMWQEIREMVLNNDKDGMSELLRVVVRTTKDGIKRRIGRGIVGA